MTSFELPEEGVNIGNRAGFIGRMIQEGMTAGEGLDLLKSYGAGYRRSDFLADWGRVRNALASSADTLSLDPNAIPDSSDLAQLAMGRGGQYATRVSIGIADMDTGVQGTAWYLHVTDEPHSPADAVEAAEAFFADNDNATKYRERVTSLLPSVTYYTVPYR